MHRSVAVILDKNCHKILISAFSRVKVFCLTPYHGLDFIKNCRKPGFHPHPNEPPLFMVAEHFRIDSSAPLEVVDFR